MHLGTGCSLSSFINNQQPLNQLFVKVGIGMKWKKQKVNLRTDERRQGFRPNIVVQINSSNCSRINGLADADLFVHAFYFPCLCSHFHSCYFNALRVLIGSGDVFRQSGRTAQGKGTMNVATYTSISGTLFSFSLYFPEGEGITCNQSSFLVARFVNK